MPSDTGCENDEQCLDGYVVADCYGTIDERNPNHGYGDDFGMQGDGLVFAEIADVGAQELLAEKPLV